MSLGEVSEKRADYGLEDAKSAWASTLASLGDEERARHALAIGAMVRGIAADGAISAEALGTQLGLEPERVSELLVGLSALGIEIDADGTIFGAALTSTKTPHVVRLGARELFAWCALDTLFIPGLVGEPADIESTCPVSGETIRLRISPDGACEYSPDGAVLSVVLPGVSGGSGFQAGPASPT